MSSESFMGYREYYTIYHTWYNVNEFVNEAISFLWQEVIIVCHTVLYGLNIHWVYVALPSGHLLLQSPQQKHHSMYKVNKKDARTTSITVNACWVSGLYNWNVGVQMDAGPCTVYLSGFYIRAYSLYLQKLD